MTIRLTPKQEVDIISAYTIDLIPMIELAKRYNRTRQGIWKLLKRNGINPVEYERMDITCQACGKIVSRTRCQIRNRKSLHCSVECYYAYLEAKQNGSYNQSRQGQRRGRQVVAEHFILQSSHVVHHEDRNTLNNQLWNLKVFATQGDHIRYHRLGPDYVTPLWDGSKLLLPAYQASIRACVPDRLVPLAGAQST